MFIAHCDASVRKWDSEGRRSRIGYVIYSPNNQILLEHSEPIEVFNSMKAEYIALISLLKRIIELKINKVKIISDCLNMVTQIKHECKVRIDMLKYIKKIHKLMSRIEECVIEWNKRKYNKHANFLSRSGVNKECVICKEEKHYTSFGRHPSKKDERRAVCKDCYKIIHTYNNKGVG